MSDAATEEGSPPEYLTVPEVAKLLRVSLKYVYLLVEEDRAVGVVRVGRLIRFHRATLVASLSSEKSAPRRKARR